MLAPYACIPENSKGRLYPEKQTPYRNEFERDRDRIIHSNSFKRLQYKTQVFVNHEGDHYRNRLTHSMEVSSIARSLCKALNLSDDLVEGVALAHDLGHSPFGHAGEEALNECMKDFGGFSHNAHSFKILTFLEQKYAAYDGLNLTWEVLEGIVKHNGPLEKKELSDHIIEYDKEHSLDLEKYSSAEAQIASLADDIAYIAHDLEDSIRAEIITYKDLAELEFVDRYIREVKKQFKDISDKRLIYEVCRKLIHHLIESLLFQTRKNITKHKIKTETDIRNLGCGLVEFTENTAKEVQDIKGFLFRKVYKHHRVASVTLQSQNVVRDLFKLYVENIELLPFSWREMIEEGNEKLKMSVIADYIAGMTDRFAIKQYQSFYNLNFANTDL
ncbi:MAG: deoxyguanosinetriphosphate triphosphohydrolase [Rickettsiaceae bacterium]|nr:deoxyguanosinetriphosphate triphosphohydrolase [Rickettsiaceae bacterium]